MDVGAEPKILSNQGQWGENCANKHSIREKGSLFMQPAMLGSQSKRPILYHPWTCLGWDSPSKVLDTLKPERVSVQLHPETQAGYWEP
jgi:hypothetical protein